MSEIVKLSARILPVTWESPHKVILAVSRNSGAIKTVGGGGELGEDHLTAAVREYAEETGLHMKPERFREIGIHDEIMERDNDYAGLKRGEIVRCGWFVLGLYAGEVLVPSDDIVDLLTLSFVEASEQFTYGSTRDVYKTIALPILQSTYGS